MLTLLRVLCLCVGTLLFVAPLVLALGFAYGVGEPPTKGEGLLFALPMLIAGGMIGTGPILVGLPHVVVGQRNRTMQQIAAMMLALSASAIVWIGFSGSVTAIAGPAILAIEAVAFYCFVYPARKFHVEIKKPPTATSQPDDA